MAAVAVAGVAFGLRELAVISTVASLLTAAGGPVVLSYTVRDRGLSLQTNLFERWGGPPTRELLRAPRNGTDTVRARRRALVEQVTGIAMPSVEEETADEADAAALYDSAVSQLREMTRDPNRFRLVFEENRTYGFYRNLLAIRPFGIALTAVPAAACAAGIGASLAAETPFRTVDVGVGAAACCALLLLWLVFPSEDRVRRAAERYAERLFAAVSTETGDQAR